MVDSVYNLTELRDNPEKKAIKFENAASAPIPDYDPVYGLDGPLPQMYREIAAKTG